MSKYSFFFKITYYHYLYMWNHFHEKFREINFTKNYFRDCFLCCLSLGLATALFVTALCGLDTTTWFVITLVKPEPEVPIKPEPEVIKFGGCSCNWIATWRGWPCPGGTPVCWTAPGGPEPEVVSTALLACNTTCWGCWGWGCWDNVISDCWPPPDFTEFNISCCWGAVPANNNNDIYFSSNHTFIKVRLAFAFYGCFEAFCWDKSSPISEQRYRYVMIYVWPMYLQQFFLKKVVVEYFSHLIINIKKVNKYIFAQPLLLYYKWMLGPLHIQNMLYFIYCLQRIRSKQNLLLCTWRASKF